MKIEQIADEEMVKNAVGEEEYDHLTEPGNIDADRDHALWKDAKSALREIYDPEIPVNIYELGLIYGVFFTDVEKEDGDEGEDGGIVTDVSVKMTLTSPGCPVAQEMPGWVQGALFPLKGVRHVDVEMIWDPPWDGSMMSETAKMQLNMFM